MLAFMLHLFYFMDPEGQSINNNILQNTRFTTKHYVYNKTQNKESDVFQNNSQVET